MDRIIPENILKNREEKLISIFRAAPVGIGMVVDRIILEANETLCRMTGYTKDEMIGKNSLFLYPTENDYNYVGSEKYDQIRKTGTGTVETRWKKKDGTVIDIILSSAPLDRNDFSKGVTFTALDITERKKTEKALAESERRLKTYMENSPDAIFIADSSGIFIELNKRVYELTGFISDELTGHHIRELHIDEEIELGINHFEEVKQKGKTRFVFGLKKKDGGNIPVLIESALLPDNRVIGYCRDITGIKKQEELLQQYARRIKHISDNIPGLLYQFNVSSSSRRFTYMSEKAGDVFGIDTSRPDYLLEYIKHIHPDYREQFILSTEESIINRSGWFCEWPFIHESGETRWYRGISNPEFNEDEIIYYGLILDITGEKQAQTALAASEAKYRGLVELAVDGIMLADHEGYITDANTSSDLILEKKHDEYIGKHISTLFTPDNIRNHPIRLDILQSGMIGISEREIFKKDGSIAKVEIHSKMMPDGTFQAIFQDITQRRKNEEALAASEARYKELVELAVDGIMLGNQEGQIIEVNSQLEKMTGKPKSALVGLNLSELFTKESLILKPLQLASLREGKTVINERILKRDDGLLLIVETHSKMMPDGTFQSIFRDITERKKNEEILAAEKERLAVTLRSIGDGVIATDPEGRILLMNRIAENLTGWKIEECANRHFNDVFRIINEFTRSPEPGIIDSVMKTGKIAELSSNTILVAKKGNEITIADSGAPIRDTDGRITGVVVVFRDITEKRRIAESLQRARKLDSLATLAGGIAHDFNNMLAGIMGYMDLARNYSKTTEDLSEYIDKAMTVINRAKSLTGQLMTFARGGEPLIKTENIEPVLKEYTLSALKESGINVKFNITADLWLCDIDSTQIGQVIYNIVTNSREFMTPPGSVEISAENVEIEKDTRAFIKPGRYVKVEIKDKGQGIESDVLPHIFDPFFTTKKKGNGLGLSTSYSIILRHGGFIDAESEYGKGSRFWFYLPASSSESTEEKKTISGKHTGTGIILVMDDEHFIREIITQMLKQMGYKTFQATEGKEMIELFGKYRDNPELRCIILDLTIPGGMGGKETVKELRKLDSSIPVFASSGYSSDLVMSNPSAYGFTDSIRKPFTMNELSMLLNRNLKG